MGFNQTGFAQIVHLLIGIVIGVAIIELFLVASGRQNPTPRVNQDYSQIARQNNQPPVASPSAKIDLNKLNKYLTVEATLLGMGGSDNLSLYYKDLAQPDQEVTINPTKSWIPASTIKSFVSLEAFRQRDLGLIDFNKKITITANNVVSTELETEDFPRLREGTQATISQLVEAMIIQSDNTAYNSLLDILDRRNINSTLKNLGLTETVVGEKLNLDDNQFQKDLQVAGRQPNTVTAKDLATFFDLLYTHQVPDAEEILAIFKKQKINNMIPALLPPDVTVAHKTGDWAPIFHDGGVVYKPNDPFILAIMTNSNNPSAIAQLAKVAYYQDSLTVGQDILTPQKKASFSNHSNIYLAEGNSSRAVLGEQTVAQKFPDITAEDLGITQADLFFDNQDSRKISAAVITPDSFLYGFKRIFENVSSFMPWSPQVPEEKEITKAQNRLAELKSTLKKNDLNSSEKLLAESEDALKNAVNDSKGQASVNNSLVTVKQINDLHYAALAEAAKNISPDQKDNFIDLVYRFQTQNDQDVKPTLAKSVIVNPLQQKPLIGTVAKIEDKKVVVSFDDGSNRNVDVSNFTPVRDFHNDQIDSQNNLTLGSKLAIIGQSDSKGNITAQFILKNIPHELPDKHQGTVIEIDPKDNILTIKEQNKQETVQIDNSTIVKGSNTGVSLEGIKAGSQVTVFGEYQNATPSGTQSYDTQTSTSSSNLTTPSTSSSSTTTNPSTRNLFKPTPKPSGTVGPIPFSSSSPSPTIGGQVILKATSISITQNGSGKNETSNPPSSSNNRPQKPSSNSNSNNTANPASSKKK